MSWIEIGAAGGLLFLAMLVAVATAAFTALLLGYIATRFYADVSSVEAMDGKLRKGGDK